MITLKFSDNLKKLRKEKAFTQEQLAEALGVTVGAVYKWENDLSMPEIRTLVELAELFDTSVDALLGYGWEKGSMGEAAEKIRNYCRERNFSEGIRFAERSLQKYPNSFEVVYRSATLYFLSALTPNEKAALRAIELYERAIDLFDQNPYEEIGILTLKNRIASCYCYLNNMDKAIELLQKNNVEGLNNAKIGLWMSHNKDRAKESLKYLSDALGDAYSSIYSICIGYANAYEALGELDKIQEIMLWLYEFSRGLRDPEVVSYNDKGEIRILTILAEISMRKGDRTSAYDYLKRAKKLAERFDAAPEYHIHVGQKFYYGDKDSLAFDDLGDTAIAVITNFLADDTAGEHLRSLWEDMKDE